MGSESAPETGSYREGGMPGNAHGMQKTSAITENSGKMLEGLVKVHFCNWTARLRNMSMLLIS